MLKKLTSNKSTFKAVDFHDGLNLVLADRTAGSAKKGTRNGSGKTALIEIVHHCLGARRAAGVATLANPALEGWEFSLNFAAAGKNLTATRAVGADELKVTGDTAGLSIDANGIVTREQWTKVLASLMFGIQPIELSEGRTPSFRQLISYFARLGPDAMSNAFETVRKQSMHDVRFITAFLLRLNWELARKMKVAAEQHTQLLEARRAVEAGAFDFEDTSLAKLQAEEAELEEEIEQASGELQNFRVHRQYGEIEREATSLTTTIQGLSQENYADRQLLTHYEEQAASEDIPDINLLLELYRDAGVELGDKIATTLEQARDFHRSVVQDRRKFLDVERRKLRTYIDDRDKQVMQLSDRRASLLEILRTHGALSEYEQLSRRVDDLRERLAQVSRRRTLQAELNQKRLRLNVVIAELRLQTQQDVEENTRFIGTLQKTFGGFSKQLYGKLQHVLEVDAGKSGYGFKIDAMDRGASEGIRHAGIFCYDAMLATLWSKEESHPGFLIHDSALFDPIEERQIEEALNVMANENTPFQYICTLNTDRLPSAFNDSEAIVLRLTDRGQSGGLLGIRF